MIRYEHVQAEPSAVWIVQHNLFTRAPILDTFIDVDGETQKIIPKGVTVVSPTECHVLWSVPRTGRAGVV